MPNDRLRDALLRNGLTPAKLAAELGVDPKTAERWITQGRPPYPKYRHAIAATLRESESYLWPDALPPERASRVAQSEVVQVYPRRAGVPSDLWRRLIDQAQERIGILAYAGLFLPEQQPHLIAALKAKAEAGARVEILLGDPDSPEVAQRGADEGIGDAMAGKVRNVLAFYQRLRDVPGVAVNFHRTTLYNSIYRFDNDMLVNAHVFGFPAAHTPVMHLRRLAGGDLFSTYADSFDRVWNSSVPVWSSAVAR
ncbi:MAG TPA: XRE family transcriptional regulator [Micromonosporaceae bacterium]